MIKTAPEWTQFKEYATYFPPGWHGRAIVLEHPAVREGGINFSERIRLISDYLRGWSYPDRESMPFYPEPGGLIPWAVHERTAALCWLPEGDDPDHWAVFAASDENRYEPIPGSTIEALVSALRGATGRSVFPKSFYINLVCHGSFEFLGDEDSSDVDLPPAEPLNGDESPSPDVELGPVEEVDAPGPQPPEPQNQSGDV